MAESKAKNNMCIYAQVSTTPEEAQKNFNNGRFSGTDINPMWRIKKLTELFGPAGVGWWTENENFEMVASPETHEIVVFCSLQLRYVSPYTGEVSKPVFGIGGNKFLISQRSGQYCNDEAYKMAYTDALSIACKALGFSSDIYFAKDRTKYTLYNDNEPPKEPSAEVVRLRKQADEAIKAYSASFTPDQKKELANQIKTITGGVANYMKVEDPDVLNKLIATFAKKEEANT